MRLMKRGEVVGWGSWWFVRFLVSPVNKTRDRHNRTHTRGEKTNEIPVSVLRYVSDFKSIMFQSLCECVMKFC